MEFIRNILFIDKHSEEVTELKQKLQKITKKLEIHILNSRKQIAQINTKHSLKSVYINGNIGRQDTLYIFRFFSMEIEKYSAGITLYFASEDYDLLQVVLKEFPNLKIVILQTPLDHKDFIERLQIQIFGKVLNESHDVISENNLKVDLEFINVFITSTKKIVSEMAQLADLTHSAPMLMSKLTEPLNIAISSRILISSIHFKGSYYIAFPKETFLNFYEKVVMEKSTEINDGNKDFASELANIIYGQCKKRFSLEGYNLDMVIPSIHLGEIKYPVVVLIPFESLIGKFYLAVAPGML